MFELQESIDEAEKELEGKQRDLETCLPRLAASPSEEDHQLINENITKIRSEIERAKVERRKCVYDYGELPCTWWAPEVQWRLKQAGKYLCVFEKIAALPDPSGHYYKTFHEVVKQCNDAAILPSVYRSIDAPIHRDMCALKDVPDIEPFSRMVIFRLFTNLAKRPRFNRFFKDKVTGGRGIMVQDVVQKTQVMITCVVLPLFFSGSVVALSMVHSMNARIAIIAVLLLVFELSSLFFMGLSQKEMIIALSA
jgi:hypothetical protein